MPHLYRAIALVALLLASACTKEEDPATPVPPPPTPPTGQPLPADNRRVTIQVDAKYDLSQTRAYSLSDSMALKQPGSSLAVPKADQALIVFVDPLSQEFMAILRADSTVATVTVTADNVAKGLFDLIPAYAGLSTLQKKEFEKAVVSTRAYVDFVRIVDGLLISKQPIFSKEKDYLAQLRVLNTYTIDNYYPKLKATATDLKDVKSWVLVNKNIIDNAVYSYTQVELNPKNPQLVDYTPILEPKYYLDPTTSGATQVSFAQFADGYYNLAIHQSSAEVLKENVAELSSKSISILASIVLGHVNIRPVYGTCKTQLLNSVIGDATSGITKLLISPQAAGPANDQRILEEVFKVTFASLRAQVMDPGCAGALATKQLMARMMVKRMSVLLTVFEAAWVASDFVQLLNFKHAFDTPPQVDIKDKLQVYDDKVLPAWVEAIKKDNLRSEYAPGEKIFPVVKMVHQSQFAAWQKSGFRVDWKPVLGDGTVNLAQTKTGTDGEATVEWTLPTNRSGDVTLMAELKDGEGRHLEGSPLKYEVKMVPVELKGLWALNWYTDNTKATLQQTDIIDFKNGSADEAVTLRYIIYSNPGGWADYPPGRNQRQSYQPAIKQLHLLNLHYGFTLRFLYNGATPNKLLGIPGDERIELVKQ